MFTKGDNNTPIISPFYFFVVFKIKNEHPDIQLHQYKLEQIL